MGTPYPCITSLCSGSSPVPPSWSPVVPHDGPASPLWQVFASCSAEKAQEKVITTTTICPDPDAAPCPKVDKALAKAAALKKAELAQEASIQKVQRVSKGGRYVGLA